MRRRNGLALCLLVCLGLLAPAAAGADSWTLTGPLHATRFSPSASFLPNGRVLLAGGRDISVFPEVQNASSEVYDPLTNKWSTTSTLGEARNDGSASLLTDGRVLLAGGQAPSGPNETKTAELYDPTTGIWSSAPSMNDAHSSHFVGLLPDGRVLVGSSNSGFGALRAEL